MFKNERTFNLNKLNNGDSYVIKLTTDEMIEANTITSVLFNNGYRLTYGYWFVTKSTRTRSIGLKIFPKDKTYHKLNNHTFYNRFDVYDLKFFKRNYKEIKFKAFRSVLIEKHNKN